MLLLLPPLTPHAMPQAQLAGHHNIKQKIKYVERMREEIFTLKKELSVLRSQVQKPRP